MVGMQSISQKVKGKKTHYEGISNAPPMAD